MKQSDLKYSSLIAVLYFGMNVNAQVTPKDTVPKEHKIEEVVMIGYGSQKKENITGSIGLVTAKDLADKPNANPISSIQGKLAGVQILNSGTPGGSPRVDIRGISSLTGKTVFIVDGMITDDISFLSPQDIESMSVLKDPSSLAIYGARASNGAVIIKTKSGRGKKPVFNFNSYLGIKTVTNIPKMVNSDQYIELFNEKLRNEGVTDPTKFLNRSSYPADTDWFKEIFRPSIINSNDISASGNAGKLNYYLSAGYLQDEGNLAAGQGINSGSGFNRFNSKVNLIYKITDNITIGNNFTFSKMRTDQAQNPLQDAYSAPPVYAPINPGTGGYQYFSLVNISNPRAKLDLFRSQTREERLLNNIWGEYKFLKDFTLRISYTSDNINSNKYEFTPSFTYAPDPKPTKLITRDSRTRNYVWDNTLSWKKSLGKHNVEVLAGFSRTRNSYAQEYADALNINYNGTNASLDIANGTDIVRTTFDEKRTVVPYQDRIESFFGRLNYDYGGKYLVNASIRRDGTSKYSSNDRYRVFPAVSAGWVISKENFMSEQNVFNLLKLRASWGKLGNPDVQRAYTLNTTIINGGAYYGNTGSPAQTIDQIIDPNIGWETTTGRDLGLEMALFNNKLKIDATYFDKDTKDVVYGIVQGTVSGAGNWNNYITNAYSFNNKGFEASVNYDTKINDNIKLGVYGNITTLKNKITSVANGSYLQTGANLYGNAIIRLQEGQPVGSYYGYQVEGIFQTQAEADAWATQNGAKAGGFKFKDIDGNGVIDARDKTFLGSPIPKGTYGFGINLNVYDFDFAIDFQGVFGNKIYNFNREQRFGNESWDLDFYNNRWHGAGTSTEYPMATNDQSIILPNSFYVEDGSYIRIRNIQVGYNLPKAFTNSMSITKLRLYVSAQNPWTSFKYHGFSPEILNTDKVQMGIDNNIYPISAIYTIGMNLTF
ncbi:SusC/RagA family TonB-linked outer membrane protein [Chryseobacterium sp. PTM-20240506]|uniref:SusC/RagA family TonB-linked outer membrane protein n=1 Tax=unclassified Chryseobacterium TaxID=2593645 RepID=UPI002358D4AC|nr:MULTISPECIES: SusC/RagA family TonB-linked outer membrane protein [unclassified Chryseobacterium]MDC8104451.1 SusC/RagA family TonB-linked outer membrane protein [Chryseobacterium sp. B21-037]MDQ1804065.1 SusC/RagA family TonB-linked outer membrane protein [Chryseobacterium sp. CKR4-1]